MKKVYVAISLFMTVAGAAKAHDHGDCGHKKCSQHENYRFFDLSDVRLKESIFKNAMDLNSAWMMEMEPDRLLSNFRLNAGLTPKGESYGSWESMGIAGHTLGHYLTAMAQQYASTGDQKYKDRVDYIVNELDTCQVNFVNGFIGGMPGGDKVFKQVKAGIIKSAGFDLNGIWVPWYNEHKTMMALSDAYLLTGNQKAFEILVKLSDYLVDVISTLNDDQLQEMLNCEFGGMNEAFAQVYALTGDKKYLDASYDFYHKRVMDPLADGKDNLAGLHSNTQIPKIVGSARQYELTSNQKDKAISEFFWHTVVHNHSYINGGNSSGEYLSTPGKLNDRLTQSTCETCNTYNMLKLSKHLFSWSGDVNYMDYYERALYNHILASQHPETGMTCYFVPLAMGTKKEFCGKYNSFTCCMGTGFENHSKYGGAIYAQSTSSPELYVNLYIPSDLNWTEQDVKVSMQTSYPKEEKVSITVTPKESKNFTVKLRHPFWAQKGIEVKVNGSKQKVESAPGSYVAINRKWKKNDKIEISLPMELRTETMPDNEDRRAVFYGPVLLAGTFGTEHRNSGDVPVFVSDDKSVTDYIKKEQKPLVFTSQKLGVPNDIELRPFYDTYDQYYTVYWDVFSPSEWKLAEEKREAENRRLARLDKMTLDYISLGEMQPERDHCLEADNSRIGDYQNRKYRMAYENGWFAFDLKCNSEKPLQLLMTYWGGDSGRSTFEVVVDDEYVFPICVTGEANQFVEMKHLLPVEYTKGKDKIRVKFKGVERNRVTNLYDCRLMDIAVD